jgi:hypothetical protein
MFLFPFGKHYSRLGIQKDFRPQIQLVTVSMPLIGVRKAEGRVNAGDTTFRQDGRACRELFSVLQE